jgi:hypothetical protein
MVQGGDVGIIVRKAESFKRMNNHSSCRAPGEHRPVLSMASLPSTVPPPRAYTQQQFSYPQAYGQFATQQYPPVNYPARPQGLAYSAFQAPFGRKDPTSWIDALPPQELSSVDPEVASKVLSRFISAELKYEGFESAEPVALERLEIEVINCRFHIQLGVVSLSLEGQPSSYSGFTPQDPRLRKSCKQDRTAS